jgi:hypothetical protein
MVMVQPVFVLPILDQALKIRERLCRGDVGAHGGPHGGHGQGRNQGGKAPPHGVHCRAGKVMVGNSVCYHWWCPRSRCCNSRDAPDVRQQTMMESGSPHSSLNNEFLVAPRAPRSRPQAWEGNQSHLCICTLSTSRLGTRMGRREASRVVLGDEAKVVVTWGPLVGLVVLHAASSQFGEGHKLQFGLALLSILEATLLF